MTVGISDCRKKNTLLDTNTIHTMAKKLYKTFVERGNEDVEPLRASSTRPTPFNASKGWFNKFHKRFELKSASLHGEAAFADKAGVVQSQGLLIRQKPKYP